MATVDSGTETLFSDDSSCDLGSPILCSGENSEISGVDNSSNVNNRLAPPNIQPYSGVLDKGKVVIRPIAFKPAVLNPATRFDIAGERYGSTPILTRPGSRLTLYGSSNDLRKNNANLNNYSLDRKLRSCQSVASSPPMSSLPRKLINYDSLESIRKSPTVNSIVNKASYRLASAGDGSLQDLTPSPSDSEVSELEAALRDRDSELAYLRQTMEHNEHVIFRVYQEKERCWEREIRRLKDICETTARCSNQKVLKVEQMLMMQNYYFQQEKKRLCGETQRSTYESERLAQDVKLLRERLEETEWNLCQKSGEISLLKAQLKDHQNDQTTKGHELLQLRIEHRDIREVLDERESKITDLQKELLDKDTEIETLQRQLDALKAPAFLPTNEEKLRKEIEELREELSEVSMTEYEGLEPGRKKVSAEFQTDANHQELIKLKYELDQKKGEFEKERYVWIQEKEKVLTYQRTLQMNYVDMYRRTRALEAEVEALSIELGLDNNDIKHKMNQTIEL